MKNLFILILLLLVVGLLLARFKPEWVPFLVSQPLTRDGREEVQLALPRAVSRGDGAAQPAADAAPPMYRWKDAQGVTQVSDQPPADVSYETLRFDPRTNVLPAQPAQSEPPPR